MHKKFIDKLICPYCRKGLKLQSPYFSKKDQVFYGFLACRCSTYPILDGILFMLKDKKLKTFIVFPLLKIVPFKYLSFNQLVNLISRLKLINQEWASYLINRFRRKDFFPTAISASLVKKGKSILDVGCGTGHLLSVLKTKTAEENLCGIDYSLPNLFLAKKYASRNSNYIHLDLNQPLPFKDQAFEYIISSDAFHYVANQKLLGRELKRILLNPGLIILTNLHNKRFSRHFTDPIDYPETPKGYIKLFPNLNSFLFSQKNVHAGILKPVKKKDTPRKINELKTFTLIFSKKKDKKLQQDIRVNLNYLGDPQLLSTI